jgi:uncharacterized protein YjiS (DUF1127 family)
MKEGYLATFVAANITTSLTSNLLRVGALGPAKPGWRGRLKSVWRGLIGLLKHLVNDLVAAMLARRERQAALFSLRRMTDRELRDVGPDRGGIDRIARCSRHDRQLGAKRASIACAARGEVR